MRLLIIAIVAVLIGFAQQSAAFTITDTVGDKFLITGGPFAASAPAVVKIRFEIGTAGTNISLCLGTAVDFANGVCATQLVGSGAPGLQFLSIVDTAQLAGNHLYAINNGPASPATFTITLE